VNVNELFRTPNLRSHTLLAVGLLCGVAGCTDASDSRAPIQGEWLGDQAGFHLENERLDGWWLQGMYCEVDDGPSSCLATPTGVPTASAALVDDTFVLHLGDLTLSGSFLTREQVEGTWFIDAPGCCSANGVWSAVLIEALPEPVVLPDDEDPGDLTHTVTPTPSVPEDVCAHWSQERADLTEPNWQGNAVGCDEGEIDEDARARVLRQVNLYRALTGLPPVALDDEYNALAQACSALMDANDTIAHVPPEDWNCYTYEGAKGAGESNLATTPAVQAIDLYMGDTGNESTLGHRRWILQNGLGPFGIGSTDAFSCLHVLGSTSVDSVAWTAWPPAGNFPSDALFTLEPVGWSFHTHTHGPLETAEVTVTSGGEVLPVEVWPLEGGYGGSGAIAFRPIDWSPRANTAYQVDVTGISPPVTYVVEVVDCGAP
jgi:uncharacterized protein YkwD